MSKILCDVRANYSSPWYSTLVVSNMRYEGGGGARIQRFLTVVFRSPASVVANDFWATMTPWVNAPAEVTSIQINSSTWEVTAVMSIANGRTFNPQDCLNFGINGNLRDDPDSFTKTFILAADKSAATTGTVSVQCSVAPDSALDQSEQTLTLFDGYQSIQITTRPNTTTTFDVHPGTFTITTGILATPEQTVVATAQVSPATITVAVGQTTSLQVTYGLVRRSNAVDIVIGKIPSFERETFYGTVTVKGNPNNIIASFSSLGGHTTRLRQLPYSQLDVRISEITLNNVAYTFPIQNILLSDSVQTVTFSNTSGTRNIPTTGFVALPIEVSTEYSLSGSISVRIASSGVQTQTFIYTDNVDVRAGTARFTALVKPGQYTIYRPNFIRDYTVYVVETPTTLIVENSGTTKLQLRIKRGANLRVPGFPTHLSFGGCTDTSTGQVPDFVAAGASSVFKYAGSDGAGDPGYVLADDPATTNTIMRARDVERSLGRSVMPVMISYTCNLSGGSVASQLQDSAGRKNSLENLILSLSLANAKIDTAHPHPATYILNPDFLGECQKEGLSASYQMDVLGPLAGALQGKRIQNPIPSTITNTLAGYVLAINWLVRTVAPKVTFGWQVNLWSLGTSFWIYSANGIPAAEPTYVAGEVARYITSLGVFDRDYPSHFLAVDRYERDDLTAASYANGYCYGPHEWRRYFDLCKALSERLLIPVMPWQVPMGRTPSTKDTVNDDFGTSQHWGTGGSYVLGDANIGSDYNNVHPKALALKFNPFFGNYMGEDVRAGFQRGEPFDLTDPTYGDFPLRGIFAVLVGGGSTTGIVSQMGATQFNTATWVQAKLKTYSENPISLNNTATTFN